MPNIGAAIPAGQMRSRVTIQKPTTTGGRQTWADWMTVWAYIDPTGGVELVSSSIGPPYENYYTIQMRYIVGVQVSDRLTFTAAGVPQTVEIENVNDVQTRHITLSLTCRQVTT